MSPDPCQVLLVISGHLRTQRDLKFKPGIGIIQTLFRYLQSVFYQVMYVLVSLIIKFNFIIKISETGLSLIELPFQIREPFKRKTENADV